MPKIELSDKEIRLLLQSLDHCLATCKQKSSKDDSCEDCDAAKALRDRLVGLQKG
jgi:hypothetical protein